ncbi:hypothetical protein [Persephonella sp.]|nr:hypothetical protein [Aquificota bacterium]
MDRFPVEKKKTPIQYFLAFLVLALVGVVFAVILIALPYLFYLLAVIFIKTLQFSIVFILVFWLVVVILLWIIKLLEVYRR